MSADEPRTAEPPAKFDTYQFVLLRRPPDMPVVEDDTAAKLQAQHLGHLAAMRDAGHLMSAGPLLDQSDESLRGVAIYRVGSIDEARRLAEADPAVQAGRFVVDVMTWLTPRGEIPFS
ncbi:MAG: YciI family protein [Actinomycetes bacterium]